MKQHTISFVSLSSYSMDRIVEVLDQEVQIEFALGCKCRANVRLRSLSTTTTIAFKVQTSSPHKFLVNPPSGLIPPLSQATFQVILKPQSQIPPSFPRSSSDRFLVKTALASELVHDSPDSGRSDSVTSWFTSISPMSTHDLKLKVAFVGSFLLRHAVSIGNCDSVKKIIKRQRSLVAELTSREAASLLKAATESGNSDEMVNLLAEAGLKIGEGGRTDDSRWGSKGWSALHAAVAFDRTEEVERLVRKGQIESVDCRDKDGRTPLHLAASKGHLNCARTLVDAGADMDARSQDGRTALYRAAANGDRRMVKSLIQMGADPTITTTDRDRTAVDAARDRGHKEVVEMLERGEAVLSAARRGEIKQLEWLLEKDASVSYRDQYGLTALHVAALKGYKDVVMLLVEFGAELESQDCEGHTPLHLAVEGGCAETVQVLINRGADVNAKSKRSATPLHIARVMGHEDLSLLLVETGAVSSVPSSSSSSLSSTL